MNESGDSIRESGKPAEAGRLPGWLHRWRKSPGAAHVVPFALFLALVHLTAMLRIENPELAWHLRAPEQWLYPLQVLVCLGALAFWWPHYRFGFPRGWRLAIAMGVAGIAIWLTPVEVHAATGIGGDGAWLEWLGFQDRLQGFDPTLLGRELDPVWSIVALGFRLVRLIIVVPLVEEIFWRGFLMRWLVDSGKPFHEIEVGAFQWRSFLITTGLFASVHAGPDFAVALIYGALAGWVTVRTRSLFAVVLMHAVANLLLGLYTLKTGFWGLW